MTCAPPKPLIAVTSVGAAGTVGFTALTILQPSGTVALDPPPMLTALTHTLCSPSVDSSVMLTGTRAGPRARVCAATSGRLTLAVTVDTVPSTLTCTLIGAVVSGSIAQPFATMFEPPLAARVTDSNAPYGSRFIVTVVQLGVLSADPYFVLIPIAQTVCLPLGTVIDARNRCPLCLPPGRWRPPNRPLCRRRSCAR